MKIFAINPFTPYFKGKREDRKSVEQLKNDNSYDLNVINQRKISKAIENLSEIPGEDNVNFLLDVSENLKYGTAIDLGKSCYNDWHVKLNNAAKKSLSLSDPEVQQRLASRLETAMNTKRNLNDVEIQILKLKDSLLSKVDRKSLDKIKNKNIKNLDRNLDYFIISSEVPLSQKLYIMKRLDYFMSPEYKINPQLLDKKTQALAEMLNDIVVDTPESKVPNIKAVNQKLHGMCAAISICRKALAYEDKANYIDMILSELDDSDYLQVYDITKLGSNTKIPIGKADVDYDYALSKGYRIIDTSALNWMNVADTAGSVNEFIGMYKPFDKENFDVFQDSHLTTDLDDSLVNEQDWLRSLQKAQDSLKTYKLRSIKQKYSNLEKLNNKDYNVNLIGKYNAALNKRLQALAPTLSSGKIHEVSNDLLKLQVANSGRVRKSADYLRDFVYLPNETIEAKSEKVKAFLSIALSDNGHVKLEDKAVKEIIDLVSDINKFSTNTKSSYQSRELARAELLYHAAAAYRTQILFQLDIPEHLKEMMTNLNIPDEETLIRKNIDFLVKKLEKNSVDPELRKVLAKNFESDDDNEAIIESLKGNKETLDYVLTESMDDLFHCCLSVNRKTVLANELNAIRTAISDNNDKMVLLDIADKLHIKDDKNAVLKTLDKYISTLNSENCTEEEYISIFNKTGHNSQLNMFKETYERLGETLFNDPEANPAIIQGFNLLNGLPKDASRDQSIEVYNRIGQIYNQIAYLISGYQRALNINSADGEVLNTVSPKMLVRKKLENIGEIIPAKDLAIFREKFSKIENECSQSENGVLRYKELPRELTELTKHEKEVLNQIESNINGWYSTVSRALDNQYRLLKEPLSEHNRVAGVKRGMFWVPVEGKSGLCTPQEVRIIEQMTDRPYYGENNGKYAIQKIKKAPYSGISSTSVDSARPAWHAQYIADIKPVEIKSGNTPELKEALFHDNTWGPSEHENTWIDENNLLRTDYSQGYGGNLGYITDDEYRTGKLIDNLIGTVGIYEPSGINNKMYKKLAGNYDGYKYPMFEDIITPGKYPNPEKFVRSIRDNTLISPVQFFPQLENHAKHMTKSEIKALIVKTQTISTNLDKEYADYERRIFGKEPFYKGINSRQDYDKLPDNDKLKVLFEKMALIRSYKYIPNQRIFYQEMSLKDLSAIKEQIKAEARKNFDYTFAKNIDITKYGAESSRYEIYALLDNFAQINKIKLPLARKVDIVNSLKNINKDDFDGSLDKTIDLMTVSFKHYMMKNTPKFEGKTDKIDNLANGVRNILRTNMGFTLADLDSSSFDDDIMKNIVKWIDETFDPATDEELVQIINNLRNMTTEEFKQRYDNKITDEAIGLKNISGYDVLMQFKSLDRRTENMLYNMMFNERLGLNLNMSKTIPTYEYNKMERKLRGARYANNKRTFDDIYFDYYYSLRLLTFSKAYERLRHDAFKKYGMFPAYPKYDYETKENIDEIIKKFYDDITEQIEAVDAYNIQDFSMSIVKKLNTYLNKIPDSQILTTRQRHKIEKDLNEFLEINGDDESIKDTVNAAKQALALDQNALAADYKRLISIMNDEMSMFMTTVNNNTMKDAIKLSMEEIDDRKSEIISLIDIKYKARAGELLNKWISARSKNSPDADKYYQEFCELFDKHIITRNPEKMLNEYLLLIAKPDVGEQDAVSPKQQKRLEVLKNALQGDLQGLLYQSNLLEFQYLLMDCAKESNLNIVRDEFKKSKLELRNGTVVTLDSDIAINLMLAPLLADSDLSSAVMFLEQLGLTENFVNMAVKNNSFDSAFKSIKRINNILQAVSDQTVIVKSELDKLGNIDKDPNYKEKLNTARENIIKKFKKTNYRLSIKIMDKAFEDLLQEIKENPARSKTALLHLKMDEAKSASIIAAKYNIDLLNDKLRKIQKVKDLMVELNLPENSPAIEQREKYLEGFHKIEEYLAANERSFPELGMHTEAAEA